jgi:hypothetical protein
MCFKENNKNFINIKLHTEMKGLSNEEKLKKYRQENQDDTRKRLKESYIKCSKKLDFYKDAFLELSFYETDFLMLNLFLEKDINSLFLFLCRESFNNLNFQNEDNISYKFWIFMKEASFDDNVSEFVKTEFLVLLEIREKDWIDESEKNSPVIKAYAIWLIESIENQINYNHSIFSYFLFLKVWNYFPIYSEYFDVKISTFYSRINSQFDESIKNNKYPNLFELVNIIQKSTEELFISEIKYYPLLNNPKILYYGVGYNRNRPEFIDRYELSNLLCLSQMDNSFTMIFNLMNNYTNSYVISKLNNDILEKLNEFQLPSREELTNIIENNYSEEVNSLKKDFLRRLYIY